MQYSGRECIGILLIFAFIGLSVALPQRLHARNGGGLPVVVTTVRTDDSTGNTLIENILDRAMSIKLETEPVEVLPSDADAVDFVLTAGYSVEMNNVKVVFSWFDAGVSSITAEAAAEGKIDLSLDTVIFDALERLLESVRPRMSELIEAPSAGPEIESASDSTAEGDEVSEGTVDTSGTGPDAGVRGDSGEVPESGYGRGFALNIAAGPFLPVGGTRDYFTLGGRGITDLMYAISRSDGLFGIGLRTGVTWFAAEGLLDTVSSFIVPIGITIRFQGNVFPTLSFFTDASGGAAFFLASYRDSGFKWGNVPYVEIDTGVAVHFTDGIGAGIAVGYVAYLTTPEIVMGFTPSLFVIIR